MDSRIAVSFLIDEPERAAEELAGKVLADFVPRRNSVGLLFCYSDMELEELVGPLADKLSFPLAGCTTIASMDGRSGMHELAATLLVLSADDCDFSLALSEPITRANVKECIEETFGRAAAALPEAPALMFALPPYLPDIMLDEYAETLGALAPGLPVVGGLPSYNEAGDHNRTIFGDGHFGDRMVLVAVSGNVHPAVVVQTVTSPPLERKVKVTRAEGNVVYRVGEGSFTDYLAEIGLPVERLADGNAIGAFAANPLMVEQQVGEDAQEFVFLRTMHHISLEDGRGTAIGRIPQGATISVCPLHREEIARAATAGMRGLARQMEAAAAEGYRFSTVLAVSCIGRYLLMTPEGRVEADRLMAELPGDMTLGGYYSYGEIGPLPGAEGSVLFAHNESLVLCAF